MFARYFLNIFSDTKYLILANGNKYFMNMDKCLISMNKNLTITNK